MSQVKRSMLPFLAIMAITFIMMDFGDKQIDYQYISYEKLPDAYKEDFSMMGPGGTGMFQHDGHTYLFILTEPDKKIDIEFVGEADQLGGNQIKYQVTDQESGDKAKIIDGTNGKFALYSVRLEKTISSSFSFINIGL